MQKILYKLQEQAQYILGNPDSKLYSVSTPPNTCNIDCLRLLAGTTARQQAPFSPDYSDDDLAHPSSMPSLGVDNGARETEFPGTEVTWSGLMEGIEAANWMCM